MTAAFTCVTARIYGGGCASNLWGCATSSTLSVYGVRGDRCFVVDQIAIDEKGGFRYPKTSLAD